MWRNPRKMLKFRKRRLLRLSKLREFEVEDISTETMRSDSLENTQRSQEISFSLTQTSTPVNSTEPIKQSIPYPTVAAPIVCESGINTAQPQDLNLTPTRINRPAIGCSELNAKPNFADFTVQQNSVPSKPYLSLKLIKDSIPKFDGKSSSLTHFIKRCRLLNSKVKPEDRENLLFLIQIKIEGYAKLLLSNSKEPETLDELFALLKKFYIRSFNVHSLNSQLMQLHQNINEPVDVFGTRVSEILNDALETAKDLYNTEQLVGVNDLLKNTAMISFIKGISNDTIPFYLNRENDNKN